MINRIIELKEVSSELGHDALLMSFEAIEDITSDAEFSDLFKFQLYKEDWKDLESYQEILEVLYSHFLLDTIY
jgi:hypothetical protein